MVPLAKFLYFYYHAKLPPVRLNYLAMDDMLFLINYFNLVGVYACVNFDLISVCKSNNTNTLVGYLFS